MSPHDVRCLAKPLVVLMASFLMPVVGMAQQEKAPARADGPDGRAGVGGVDQQGLQATAAEIERVAALGAVVVRSPRDSAKGSKGSQGKASLPKVVRDSREGNRISQIVVGTPGEMVGLGLPEERAELVAEASKYAVRISNLRDSQGGDVWKPLIASGVVIKAKNDDRGCYAVVARHSVNEIRDVYEKEKDPTDWAYRRDRVHTKHVVEIDFTRWPDGYLVDVEVKKENGGYKKIPGTVIGCNGEGSPLDQYPSFDYCVVRLSKPAGFGGVALSPSSATGGLVSLGFSQQYNKPESKPGDSQPILLADPGCSEMEPSEKKKNSLGGVKTNCHGYDGFSGGPVIGFSKNGEPQLAGIIVRGGDGTASSRTQEGRKPSYTQGTFVRATSIYEGGELKDMGMGAFIEGTIKRDLWAGNEGKCK